MSESAPLNLSEMLSDMAVTMRRYISAATRPTLDALPGLFAAFQAAAVHARCLEGELERREAELERLRRDIDREKRRGSAWENEALRLQRELDELEAVARDLDLVAPAKAGEIGRSDLRAVVHPQDREQLQAEHREAQAAIARLIDCEARLRAREAEIAGQNGCGNDVLQFPVRDRTHRLRVITGCGGPDDGDAA